jgi:hypothetical protein
MCIAFCDACISSDCLELEEDDQQSGMSVGGEEKNVMVLDRNERIAQQ